MSGKSATNQARLWNDPRDYLSAVQSAGNQSRASRAVRLLERDVTIPTRPCIDCLGRERHTLGHANDPYAEMFRCETCEGTGEIPDRCEVCGEDADQVFAGMSMCAVCVSVEREMEPEETTA